MGNSKIKLRSHKCRGNYQKRRNIISLPMRRIINNPVVSTTDAEQITNAVPPLTGNRIINLHLLKNYTAKITKHASECGGEVKLSGEHNQR